MCRNIHLGSVYFRKVIVRRDRQMAQFRTGLKDTGLLKMLKERPDLAAVLFPRSAEAEIEAQVVCHANNHC